MDQVKFDETCNSWAKYGGFVGFAITFFLFGFGDETGATGIMLAALKGFVGGGLGAATFYCLAGAIYSKPIAAKLAFLAVVIVLSLLALFLANKFSTKFKSITDPHSVIEPAEVVSIPAMTSKPKLKKKSIVVFVTKRDGKLSLSTNSIIGLGQDYELVQAAKELADQDPEFEIMLNPLTSGSDEDVDDAIEIFIKEGVKNVRRITREDLLRLQQEHDERYNN